MEERGAKEFGEAGQAIHVPLPRTRVRMALRGIIQSISTGWAALSRRSVENVPEYGRAARQGRIRR